jgi:predicted secreted Zn-dependent protease
MQMEIFMKTLATSAFLAIACAIPAWANVGIKEVNSNYELRGTTTKEIHENILKNAPHEEGNIVDAETKESVTFALGYKTEEGTCRIASDQVNLDIISTFPRWVDQERATNETRRAWESYSNALRGHEDGHKAIAVKAANAIDALIHAEQGASTCASIEARIAKAADKISSIATCEQESFDKSAPTIDIEDN